jgi:hypothetical protein
MKNKVMGVVRNVFSHRLVLDAQGSPQVIWRTHSDSLRGVVASSWPMTIDTIRLSESFCEGSRSHYVVIYPSRLQPPKYGLESVLEVFNLRQS